MVQSYVEKRYVKTIYVCIYKNYKWIDLLSRFVSKYNARKHRTIGMRSIDVTLTIADKFLNTVYM